MNKNILVGIIATAFLLTGVPAMASQGGNASSTPATINHTCILAAVNVREQSVIDAWTAFNTSIGTALTTRKASLNTAWAITDKKARRTAIKTAWDTFKTSSKTAHKTLKAARKSAWNTFKTASKACKVNIEEDQSNDEII